MRGESRVPGRSVRGLFAAWSSGSVSPGSAEQPFCRRDRVHVRRHTWRDRPRHRLVARPPPLDFTEQWDLRAKADRENKSHWFRGKSYDYPSLLTARAPGFAHEITVEKRREQFLQCRGALEALGRKFNEVAPDAVVIIGNDQRIFFNAGLTPSITVYRGAQITNVQHLNEDAPGLNIAEEARQLAGRGRHPGATALADHILDSLADEGFDLAQSDQTPSGAPRGASSPPTASSTTPSCRTRRRRACRSS